ncbi:DNA polymerase III subunit chi [Pseudopontixanthobacter vadosimaris]|uniref:DNA polymerase III subunit chi n=1 Tax=Pseudopontixanthobacter vadosimaris TaxID=2726450 RepID=UPI001473EF2B|nr:DNA polymerase III subunit chi [Pseudopontixanthobacter vadosimaris]
MRVDFYQLSRDPAEKVVPLLARATFKAGERLLVVSGDAAQLQGISDALWDQGGGSFLANGLAGAGQEERQPALLSRTMEARNGARYCALADGQWREGADDFARVFLLFGDAHLKEARACWRMLDGRDGLERNFWKQEGGKWTRAA